MRGLRILSIVAGLLVPAQTPLAGGWPPTGLPLCSFDHSAFEILPLPPLLVRDSARAVVIIGRLNAVGTRCPEQRVSPEGALAPWPAPGAPVPLLARWAVPDGAGGVIAVWRDDSGAEPRLFASRWQFDGTTPTGWADPIVTVADSHAMAPAVSLVSDGDGGAFFAWVDEATPDRRLYVQHLFEDGTTASSSGVAVCTIPGGRTVGPLLADGAGGAFLAWTDSRAAGLHPNDVYAQRVSGALAPAWTAQGVAVCSVPWNQRWPALAPDGAGGIFIAWEDDRNDLGTPDAPVPNYDVYLQRLTGSGEPAIGWASDGAQMTTVSASQTGVTLLADGLGGVFLSWNQGDPAVCPAFVHRVGPDGQPPPGWSAGGLAAGTLAVSSGAHWGLVSDHQGGCRVVWSGFAAGWSLRAQTLDATGGRPSGWPPEGILIASFFQTTFPLREGVVDASDGTLYVMWSTSIGGVTNRTYTRYLQHLGLDGLVAVQASLVRAEAGVDVVRLRWFIQGTDRAGVRQERSDASGAWIDLGPLISEGEDYALFEDRDVVAGETYGYRLAYFDEGTLHHTPAEYVRVPARSGLSLSGAEPNPAGSAVRLVFTLAPDPAPARIEIVDVAGRRWWSERIAANGGGPRDLTISRSLPPGAYRVTLSQGRARHQAAFTVVR